MSVGAGEAGFVMPGIDGGGTGTVSSGSEPWAKIGSADNSTINAAKIVPLEMFTVKASDNQRLTIVSTVTIQHAAKVCQPKR
jgi:hypothetical protein